MNSPGDATAAPSRVQLVCPECHTTVARRNDAYVCESAECRRRYLIIDDIPKFIIEDARQMEPDDWEAAMSNADSPTFDQSGDENNP